MRQEAIRIGDRLWVSVEADDPLHGRYQSHATLLSQAIDTLRPRIPDIENMLDSGELKLEFGYYTTETLVFECIEGGQQWRMDDDLADHHIWPERRTASREVAKLCS